MDLALSYIKWMKQWINREPIWLTWKLVKIEKHLSSYISKWTHLNSFPLLDKETIYPAAYPLSKETHGGDDVAVFALGKMNLKSQTAEIHA